MPDGSERAITGMSESVAYLKGSVMVIARKARTKGPIGTTQASFCSTRWPAHSRAVNLGPPGMDADAAVS